MFNDTLEQKKKSTTGRSVGACRIKYVKTSPGSGKYDGISENQRTESNMLKKTNHIYSMARAKNMVTYDLEKPIF